MTNLVRFSPGYDLRQMQREIDQLFNGFFPSSEDDAPAATWMPRVDMAESGDAYRIVLDVPGLTRNDIEISYQEGILTVRGERKQEAWDETFGVLRHERTFGPFFRAFRLPKAILIDDIEAQYADGVLKIYVPKAEESKPRRIAIS